MWRKVIDKINGNEILRNVVLALCGLIVAVFVVNIMLNLFTRHNVTREVPDFAAMNIDQAIDAAKQASLTIEVSDSLYVPSFDGGTVLDQIPSAGTAVKPGRRIFVTVNSFTQKIVEIPYVTGFSLRQAKNNIEVAGLEIDKLIYQSDLATNNILEQRYNGRVINPSSRMKVEIGSAVTLVVGMGGDAVNQAVPKLIGFPLNEAKSRIWEMGMNVGRVEYDGDVTPLNRNEARVYAQSPGQGWRVGLGTNVDIKLTLDMEKIKSGSKASDKAAKQAVTEQQIEEQLIKSVE